MTQTKLLFELKQLTTKIENEEQMRAATFEKAEKSHLCNWFVISSQTQDKNENGVTDGRREWYCIS